VTNDNPDYYLNEQLKLRKYDHFGSFMHMASIGLAWWLYDWKLALIVFIGLGGVAMSHGTLGRITELALREEIEQLKADAINNKKGL